MAATATTPQTDILKKESVMYLKSKINGQQGTLVMTPNHISLEARKSTVNIMGLVGLLLKAFVEKPYSVFNFEYSNIQSLTQGKHGLAKNVLEITDKQNNTYRIIVKNYAEWEEAIKKKM